MLVVAILFIAYLATYVRRTFAFDSVLRQASPYAQAVHQQSTHLIAHSFGTYLTARALRKRDDFRLGRIVLVGCVLPRRFPWARLEGGGGRVEKFLAVRNEVGGQDLDPEEQRLLNLLIEDQSLGGIAAQLGISYSNAGVRVHRLREKLRKHMQDKGL